MLNVNYKSNVRCNGLADGVPKLSSAPFRKMGVHHASGGGIIPKSQDSQTRIKPKPEFSDKYKPLFANIPSANNRRPSMHSENRQNSFQSKNNDFLKNDKFLVKDTEISKLSGSGNVTLVANIHKKLSVSQALNSRRSSNPERANGAHRNLKLQEYLGNSTTKHSIIGFNKHRRHSGHQRNPQTNQDIQPVIKIEPTPNTKNLDLFTFDSFYQKHWFSRELEILATCSNSLSARNARLDMTHMEMRRQIAQMKCAIKQNKNMELEKIKAKIDKNLVDLRRKKYIKNLQKRKKLLVSKNLNVAQSANNILSIPGENPLPRNCAICQNLPALPCTKYCASHIMSNSDQVLFDFCTAKFSDNTQCSRPVFDVAHELPLCAEHARKRDNYDKMVAEIKPKKHSQNSKDGQPKIEKSETSSSRKRAKPSAMIRPQRRSKKRKRSSTNQSVSSMSQSDCQSSPVTVNHNDSNDCHSPSAITNTNQSSQITINQLNHPVDTEIIDVEHALVTQASRLLEETDFTTVLNQIPADEFNELFGDPRNGVYGEPSAEETEELERALLAVDNDVKSLEKLSQTHALLDQFLTQANDDDVLVDVATDELPDVVFHTAYVAATPQ